MKLSKSLLMSSIIILSSVNIAFANHFSGGFGTGKLTYGVGGGDSSTIKTAASQWNGISSKVSLTYSSATDKYGLTANIIAYANNRSGATAGSLGELIPYKSYTGTSAMLASTKDRWVKATAYQYKTPDLNTATKRIATMTHELGHALSVAHPTKNTDAVMKQGVKTSYTLKTYDKSSLKSKWGK